MIRTHLSDRVYHGVLLALMLVCSVLLLEKMIWSMQTIPLMYNEGWNAVHTSRAMSGEHLYQYDTAFLVNNYPPCRSMWSAYSVRLDPITSSLEDS